MKRLKVGVVGVGYLGSLHVRVLSEIDKAELVGIYDIDGRRASIVSNRYGVHSYGSLEELLEDVEAVVCAVPTTEHHKVGMKVLEANKHLLMEKPIAETSKQASELVREAERRGLKLMVGHIERFNPAILAGEKYIEQPFYIETLRIAPFNSRGTDVDVIKDLMIHDIDLALNYIGEEPEMVHAIGSPVLTNKVDIANVRMQFPSGAVANLTASRVSLKKVREMRIFQKDLYISMNLMSKEIYMIRKDQEAILPYFPTVDTSLEPLKLEVEEFVEAVLMDRKPKVDGKQALKALKVAERIVKDISGRLEKVNATFMGRNQIP